MCAVFSINMEISKLQVNVSLYSVKISDWPHCSVHTQVCSLVRTPRHGNALLIYEALPYTPI